MSDEELIRRGDAISMLLGMRGPVDVPRTEKAVWVDEGIDRCIEELRDMPAVTVGVKPLRDLLEAWIELASRCTIEEGVCCCGDNIEGHSNPMNCGHSPVDHGSYIADSLVERTIAALKGDDHE